jgi:hypothetical protein
MKAGRIHGFAFGEEAYALRPFKLRDAGTEARAVFVDGNRIGAEPTLFAIFQAGCPTNPAICAGDQRVDDGCGLAIHDFDELRDGVGLQDRVIVDDEEMGQSVAGPLPRFFLG